MREQREDCLLNGRQCAESIGISARAFHDWKVPCKSTRGREKLYALADVLAVYRERCGRELEKEIRQEVLAGRSGAPDDDEIGADPFLVKLDLDKKRARLTEAQAINQEMKNEMMRHEVAPFAFITFVLGKTSNALAGVMDSLPVELMRRLNLRPHDLDKVRAVTAQSAESIAALGDESWVSDRFDEYLTETDQ